MLLCDPQPIRKAFVGEPVEEVLEIVRWTLKHQQDAGFDVAKALPSWARRHGRVENGPPGRDVRRRQREGLRWPVVSPRSTTPPRGLVSLHERANGLPLDGEGIQAGLEWEAMRWRVPVEISRAVLEALVERSVVLEREKHRMVHGEDWRRWGSRGGRETLRRYGPHWFALLARRRWGRIGPEELEAARVSR